MSTADSCIVAAIVVLIVVIIAVIIRRRHWKSKDGNTDAFMPGDAATPKLREAVSLIGGDLLCISKVADSLESRGAQIESAYGSVDMGPAYNEARLSLVGAKEGMAEIVKCIKRLQKSTSTMTPTYENALSVYRGLQDSDKALWGAAQSLDHAGKRMQDLVSSTDDHTHTAQVHFYALKQELAAAAAQMRQMATCFYSLVRSVHYLGSSLQLE